MKQRHVVAMVIGGLTLISQVAQGAILIDVILAVGINVAIVYGVAAIVSAVRNRRKATN